MNAPGQAEIREMTDENVVRMAQQGDVAAFERIYRLHSRKVYTLCLRMVSDRSEAKDLTQDVFLQLFREINIFRGESAFSTWLSSDVREHCTAAISQENAGGQIVGNDYESRRGIQR
ncbi:MAG: sigma-70 family RNA polymerase sigma factor [Candidatus Acidiferrales bacterium]